MRIAFDLRRIMNPGIGRYMRCLVETILRLDAGHEFLLLLPPDAREAICTLSAHAQKVCCAAKYYSVREQFDLPRILRAHKIDLLHSPHFLLPLVRPCPAVVTIHDVIYLACKEDLPSRIGRAYYRGMMMAAARGAVRIITDSEYSKSDIVRHLGADPGKVDVIYPAPSPVFQPVADRSLLDEARRKYSIGNEFILYAGIYKPRKNHAGLLRAFQKLSVAGVRAQLVIAGPLHSGEKELARMARELHIAEHVRFTGLTSDSDLAALYSAARVYACPSVYEGFGFTVLEAMACGTPVVCSPETSLPEVAGQAALYADVRDPERFADALRRAFCDEQIRGQMIHQGYENCRRFTWEATAAQTLAVYQRSAPTLEARAVPA